MLRQYGKDGSSQMGLCEVGWKETGLKVYGFRYEDERSNGGARTTLGVWAGTGRPLIICVCVFSLLKEKLLKYSWFTIFVLVSGIQQGESVIYIHKGIQLLSIFSHAGHCRVFSKVPCDICVSTCSNTQTSPTLCDSVGCNPPASNVHGIFSLRILE